MTNNKKYLVTAYAMDESLAIMTEEDAKKMTHLNIAFGHVKDDRVTVDHMKHMGRLKQIREYNPDIQILLSIGGWGAGGFSEAASTEEGRRLFASTSVDILKKYELEGIDIDWEYPCYSEASIASSPDDKTTFTLMLKELREQLDEQGKRDNKYYMLTIAAGADQYFVDGTEMDKAHQYLDYVQLMTYDMRGGFQTLTGHHTNLYTPTGDLFRISADRSVQIFVEAGVPIEKIVLGAAFYSRMWKDVPNVNNGLHQMTSSFGGSGPRFTELEESYINKNGYTRFWDDEAKAPYLFNGENFITYDDEESLKHKCEYIKQKGIAGIMYWEYRCDLTHKLLHTLYQELTVNP